jgi:hexokinase
MVQSHGIAIDGSLFEKMPGFAQELQTTLQALLKCPLTIRLAKDGSGIGAAIGALVAERTR